MQYYFGVLEICLSHISSIGWKVVSIRHSMTIASSEISGNILADLAGCELFCFPHFIIVCYTLLVCWCDLAEHDSHPSNLFWFYSPSMLLWVESVLEEMCIGCFLWFYRREMWRIKFSRHSRRKILPLPSKQSTHMKENIVTVEEKWLIIELVCTLLVEISIFV